MMSTNRNKPRTLRLDHETAMAMDDACEWMRAVSNGLLSDTPKARMRQVNLILRAALEAVMSYEPRAREKLCWPVAFTARERTAEEKELHELLRTAAAQSDETCEPLCDACGFHRHFPNAKTTPKDCFHCPAAAAARGGPASRLSY